MNGQSYSQIKIHWLNCIKGNGLQHGPACNDTLWEGVFPWWKRAWGGGLKNKYKLRNRNTLQHWCKSQAELHSNICSFFPTLYPYMKETKDAYICDDCAPAWFEWTMKWELGGGVWVGAGVTCLEWEGSGCREAGMDNTERSDRVIRRVDGLRKSLNLGPAHPVYQSLGGKNWPRARMICSPWL